MEVLDKSIEVTKLFNEVILLLRHTMAKTFEEAGFTAPQGMIIGILSKYGKMKISELSNKMGLSNSAVSGIVDRLEKAGMVERVRSDEDRRIVYARLSPKFEELHQDFHKKSEENMGSILRNGTREEIDKIVEGLNTLKNLLKK